MKTKYLFIYAPGVITHDTVIYTVMIGTSKQDCKILRFLESLSFNHDYYFRKYDNEAAEFVYRIKESFLPPGRIMSDTPPRRTVSAKEIKKAILDGLFSHKPLPRGYYYTATQIDINLKYEQTKKICYERK